MSEPDPPNTDEDIDWSLTTWEGSRREQLRRWAKLPLERAIMAVEEMEAISESLLAQASIKSLARESATEYSRDPTTGSRDKGQGLKSDHWS